MGDRMERYIDVMKQALAVMETMEEGLAHIATQLHEGRVEQSLPLFEDVMTAYAVLERSLFPVFTELKSDAEKGELIKLRQSLEMILTGYEEQEYGRVKEVIQFTALPKVKQVKSGLEQLFSPFLVS
ncbi:hypothetical protein [Halalkalibacter oceani]|uniref:DUF8042 domain-containing protein n=1 Tax=Halalkalibacter oceani TaxID=1653776 RepID=A0A9X2IQK2_9BACI|nr:hypothetical protein [Halalkalibacter oceani]MCM3714653.1 hypothetical protein [Halalkalibacter oceani]